jgi:hypothetical protein
MLRVSKIFFQERNVERLGFAPTLSSLNSEPDIFDERGKFLNGAVLFIKQAKKSIFFSCNALTETQRVTSDWTGWNRATLHL